MRFFGIDPGYALVGWAVIDFDDVRNARLVDYGVITTDKHLTIPERLNEIAVDISSLLDKFQPQYAGVETLLFQKNVKTAMSVSQARGVMLYMLQNLGIGIVEVSPLQVKSSIAGYGRATKAQVQENVRMICGLETVPKPDDAADAVAVAICAYDMIYSGNLSSRLRSE